MILYKENNENLIEKYQRDIKNIVSLSELFAQNSEAPYLNSRAAENIYCNSFGAVNLGRSDIAIDAIYKNVGVGIKTFLHNNGNTLQKIAEFNKQSNLYRDLPAREKVSKIAQLRNERLQFAINNYGVEDLIYHCITRGPGGIVNFYEQPMDFIDIKSIHSIVIKENSISFHDKKNEYVFNLTKSTLYKRFMFKDDTYLVDSIQVNIINDAYTILNVMMNSYQSRFNFVISQNLEEIVLPLYSFRKSKGKFVPRKSGLNQWNASGRVRNKSEAYIPVSKRIHKKFPGFFPSRNSIFELKLPNGKVLSAKICQDGDKAIMSNPNKELGEWLLRDVLGLVEGEILTYEYLESIGVDSVRITKSGETNYSIDFCELGTYDEFVQANSL